MQLNTPPTVMFTSKDYADRDGIVAMFRESAETVLSKEPRLAPTVQVIRAQLDKIESAPSFEVFEHLMQELMPTINAAVVANVEAIRAARPTSN